MKDFEILPIGTRVQLMYDVTHCRQGRITGHGTSNGYFVYLVELDKGEFLEGGSIFIRSIVAVPSALA